MSLWSSVFSLALIAGILTYLTPLLFASIGGAITQQADILNIGLEGLMLMGAFTGVVVGSATGSPWLGVLGAIGSALLLSLVYAVCALWLKADFIVVGIGLNLLATGITVLLLQVIYNTSGSTPAGSTSNLPKIHIPLLGDQTPLVFVALLTVPLYAFLLYRTRFGVHLRAVGEDLPAALAAGINGTRMKLWSILLCGVLCGLGGAQLSMANLGSFTRDMTAGRGFIAVAALTFGRARPVPTLVAAVIFGAADAIADRLGVAGVNTNLAKMAPYVITIVALTIAAIDLGKRRRQAAAVSA